MKGLNIFLCFYFEKYKEGKRKVLYKNPHYISTAQGSIFYITSAKIHFTLPRPKKFCKYVHICEKTWNLIYLKHIFTHHRHRRAAQGPLGPTADPLVPSHLHLNIQMHRCSLYIIKLNDTRTCTATASIQTVAARQSIRHVSATDKDQKNK